MNAAPSLCAHMFNYSQVRQASPAHKSRTRCWHSCSAVILPGTWSGMSYSPPQLVLIGANAESKFNLVLFSAGQRRLVFPVEKVPAFRVLGPHRKHCHGHIVGQTEEREHSESWDTGLCLHAQRQSVENWTAPQSSNMPGNINSNLVPSLRNTTKKKQERVNFSLTTFITTSKQRD